MRRTTIITIRADQSLRRALLDRARARGTNLSDVVREILEEAVSQRPLGLRAGRLRGAVRLPDADETWRDELRRRNWRT